MADPRPHAHVHAHVHAQAATGSRPAPQPPSQLQPQPATKPEAPALTLERVRDTVFVEGLLLHTVIGIDPDELHQPQPVVVDVELGIDHLDAGQTDCIGDALDYGAVRLHLLDLARTHRVQLLEALAELMASTLMQRFGASRARVRVAKPNKFADVAALGVCIERRRAGTGGPVSPGRRPILGLV